MMQKTLSNETIKIHNKVPVKEGVIDLGFHDDELIGMNIDFEKMEASLKIKTFTWEENENQPDYIKKEAKGEPVYCARPDKIKMLYLKLKETDNFFSCNMRMLIPQTILWTYIDGENFDMTLVLSDISFKIAGHEIVDWSGVKLR